MLKPRIRPPKPPNVLRDPSHPRSVSSVPPARSNFRPNPNPRTGLPSPSRPHARWLSHSAPCCLPRRKVPSQKPSWIGTLDLGDGLSVSSDADGLPPHFVAGPSHDPTQSEPASELESSAGPETMDDSLGPELMAPESIFEDYHFHRCLRHIELRAKDPAKLPRRSFISYIRLRESCKCSECLDPYTQQKNFTLGQIIGEVESSGFKTYGTAKELIRFVPSTPSLAAHLEVRWGHQEDAHVSRYTRSELLDIAQTISIPSSQQRGRTWGSAEALMSKARHFTGGDSFAFKYNELVDQGGNVKQSHLGLMLRQLTILGLVLVKGVPTDTTLNEDCALRRFANMIGPIRNTFYGETWDVINKKDESRNVAYTDKDLGAHMDLMYFENPPRYQLLHCLRNKVHGGQSYFVDGFHIRQDMSTECRPEFVALKRFRIPFVYKNDGHDLVAHRAVFEREPFTSDLSTIAWSPPFQGATGAVAERFWRDQDLRPRADFNIVFLRGIRQFERRVNDPAVRYEFTMEEGDLVLFDNRRVLHARRGFRDLTEEERIEHGVEVKDGEPSRWLKGCYLDGDAVWDKLAVLENHWEEAQTAQEERRLSKREAWDRRQQRRAEGIGERSVWQEDEDDLIGGFSDRW